MDSRQLLYFRAVVDHGSFTHAAEALDMTQPSLSLSIRKLEKELNVQLLTRGRAGVKTTEAGVYLYSIASKVETLLSDATQRISEIAEGTAGSVSISSAPEFNWLFMPEVLHRMFESAPDVNIFLDDPEPTITLNRVLEGSIDLGLMPSTDPQAFAQRYRDELIVHEATEMEFRVAVPERLSHLPDPVSLADLSKETWILPPRHPEFIGMPELLDQVFLKTPGAVPSRIQEISTLQTGLPLVSGGIGICLLPSSAQALNHRGIHYHRIAEGIPPMQALLIFRRDRDLSPAAKQLVDLILDVGGESEESLLDNANLL
ncbi:TPA: LysR family transcriptional regulator [Corynebacterium striatum]|nr:LysR family transcriptional regulator [Corynebacterium striatum]